jgi:hypothetical protein
LVPDGPRNLSGKRKRLAALNRGIERIVDAAVDGTANKAMTARLDGMEREQEALEKELAALETAEPVIRLHPGAAEKYRRIVTELQSHLDRMEGGPAAEAVVAQARNLIDRIEVTPAQTGEPDGLRPAVRASGE